MNSLLYSYLDNPLILLKQAYYFSGEFIYILFTTLILYWKHFSNNYSSTFSLAAISCNISGFFNLQGLISEYVLLSNYIFPDNKMAAIIPLMESTSFYFIPSILKLSVTFLNYWCES